MSEEQTPDEIEEVLADIEPGDLPVNSQEVLDSVYATTAEVVIEEWKNQLNEDRKLRNVYARWIFILITIQVLFVFALVLLIGFGCIQLNTTVLSVLIPSVLGEIFGLGFIVAKYAFQQPDSAILDILPSLIVRRDDGP